MTAISEQRQFYDERWAAFTYPGHLELDRVSKVIDLMRHVRTFARICDLGCGAGWISGILSHFGKTVGVDLSDLERARARFPNCMFISANILEWEYPRAAFDLVVSSEVIEHIPYPMQRKYLEIAYGLLAPGGALILTTPNRKTMDAIPGGGRTWSNQPIEDWLDKHGLNALLHGVGFQLKRSTSVTLGIGNMGMHRFVNSPKLNVALQRAGLVDAWRRLALALDFGVHLAVLAEKPANDRRGVS
ncbi:MAG: methyltransferase domain-containing protein [Burkholderiales bacterium]|nr:methyltransferase domain-containing protein [Burkholderiales bacterium]